MSKGCAAARSSRRGAFHLGRRRSRTAAAEGCVNPERKQPSQCLVRDQPTRNSLLTALLSITYHVLQVHRALGGAPMSSEKLLEFRSITKEFGGTRALSQVSLDLHPGRSWRFLEKTARANRHSSRPWPASTGRTAAIFSSVVNPMSIGRQSLTNVSLSPLSTRTLA